jgi:branched-chain amino acid transport system permease protein
VTLFLQYLVNGIFAGSFYTLLAVGLSLTFSIMRIINVAHGEFYMVGAYMLLMGMGWAVTSSLTANYWLGFLVAIAIGAGLGFVAERLVYRPTYGRSLVSQLIVSMGAVFFLQEVIRLVFGGVPRRVESPYSGILQFGTISITVERVLVIGVTVVVLIGLSLFFMRTKTGIAMRAAAENPLGAGMVGIDIYRMSSLAFIMAGILAAVAGSLVVPVFQADPLMGSSRVLGITFVIVILGGLGSIPGAIIAGYLAGLVENFLQGYVSIEWSFMGIFAMLIVGLMIRPRGLFGEA